MAQQTAVEYLFKQYELTGDISNSQWDKAKRMHKEQIMDAYIEGGLKLSDITLMSAEDYYNDTYTQSGTEQD